MHEILHQPSPHNIPNINNQKEISNENHQNQVEEAESFTIDNDNLSDIFQNTEEEIIFEPDEVEINPLQRKNTVNRKQILIKKEMKMS